MGIPLTIIGGFLGAGKTSLLNFLLKNNQNVAYAVLVNEFGDLAIDEDLIVSHDGQTIALANGCVCCSLSNDLMETLVQVIALKPDHIVIEASGVADPGRLRDLAYLDRDLKVGGVVVVIDSAAFLSQLDDPHLADTMEAQVRSADILLLNKCDLVMDRSKLIQKLIALNSVAQIAETEQGAFPFAALLDLTAQLPGTGSEAHLHNKVFKAISFTGITELTPKAFCAACEALPSSVVRLKGFIEADGQMFEVQRSGLSVDVRPAPGCKPDLVLIGTSNMPSRDEIARLLRLA